MVCKRFFWKYSIKCGRIKGANRNAHCEFIDKLVYFVPGSSSYWRIKKSELYSWINHHIEEGRGASTVFLTLSCAEFFRPTLKRLLTEYMLLCEGKQVDLENNYNLLTTA
jgi:hypothetical protein